MTGASRLAPGRGLQARTAWISGVRATSPPRPVPCPRGPNGLSINCDDVRLYPNGTVEASKDATLVYPDKKGSFADATFGPKVFSSGGVDIGEGVDQSCGTK